MFRALTGASFQIFGIGLLFLQALVAPLLLGLNSYGMQILLLLPAFLAQALVEPAFQANLNQYENAAFGFVDLSLPAVLFFFATLVYFFASIFLEQQLNFLVLLAFGLFLFNTFFQARAFAMEKHKLATQAAFCQFIGYAFGLGLGFQNDPGQALILANVFAFGMSFATYFFEGLLISPVRIGFLRTSWTGLMDGMALRMPVLNISTFFIIVLSKLGTSADQIAALRIFMSALNAGRYLNVVSLQRLQVELHGYIKDPKKSRFYENEIFRMYTSCFIFYALCLAILFPVFFGVLFASAPFGHLSTFFSALFVLIQPLTYAIFTMRNSIGQSVTLIYTLVSILSLASFSFLVIFDISAFGAVALSITLTASILAITTGYLLKDANETDPTKPRHR